MDTKNTDQKTEFLVQGLPAKLRKDKKSRMQREGLPFSARLLMVPPRRHRFDVPAAKTHDRHHRIIAASKPMRINHALESRHQRSAGGCKRVASTVHGRKRW